MLSDEVYEHMVFDGRAHASVLGRDSLAARSFVVSSFGKTYHATGWKVGYCVAPAELTAEFRKVHQFVQFAVATPIQAALADFLAECPAHHLGLSAFYQDKRDHFCRLLAQTPLQFRAVGRNLFPARRVFRRERFDGCRVRALAHERNRRRRDTGLGVFHACVDRAGRAILFRQE